MGVWERGGLDDGGSSVAGGRFCHLLGHRQHFCAFSKQQKKTQSTEKDSINRINRESFGAAWHNHILINVIHWPHRPCSASWLIGSVCNKSTVKADLAIYSYMFGVSRYCKSVGLIFKNIKDLVFANTVTYVTEFGKNA